MRCATRCGFLLMAALMAANCGRAENQGGSNVAREATPLTSRESFDGVSYVAEEEPSLTLTLRESSDGGITGTLVEGGASMQLVARRQGAGFAGTVGPSDGAVPFIASKLGDSVVLDIGAADEGQRLTFRRVSPGHAGAAPVPAATGGERNVVINDRRLSDEEVAQAEQSYRIRIPDADYWYDGTLGAWGVKGGPTMGFIAAGLDLGGALRPDASGGGTNVFVNGRELHSLDLMALQQITGPIMPGRYFITAQGLAGYEGGPPLWDLAAMAAQSQGGGGGSNTWQSGITGASGFSDGTTGAVFLPNGGIVSTGN